MSKRVTEVSNKYKFSKRKLYGQCSDANIYSSEVTPTEKSIGLNKHN